MIGPFYPLLRKINYLPQPYFSVLAYLGIFIFAIDKTSEILTENQIEEIKPNSKTRIDPIAYSLHNFSLVSIFSISLYYGIKFYHTLPQALLQSIEKLDIITHVKVKYRIIIGMSLLTAMASAYLNSSNNKLYELPQNNLIKQFMQ